MEITEAIRTKRAIRSFTDEPLPEDAIHAILNAGRRSPTAGNAQYLTFIGIRDKEVRQQLSTTAQGTGHLARAAFVVAIVSSGTYGPAIVHFDIGQAAIYMMLAAWELGIGSNVARMTKREEVGVALNLPEDVGCEWAISFGYPAQSDALSAPPKAGGRKEFDEVVRWDRWE
ncbi:MAG TPA: nitroreductase family protein [Chloroflexia bacterium]|jgi:nitroreductase